MTPLPPLPPQWPYAPRAPLGDCPLREGVALPGLPGVWRLQASAGLRLGAAQEPTSTQTAPPPAESMGDAFGRGGVLRAGEVVLRPYRRGGLARHLNGRIYASPARFQAEFEVHRALWEAGLPTVEPLGWAWRRRLWGVEGVFLTRYAPALPWPRTWAAGAVLTQLAVLLRALSDWGLLAPDLNATNLLVAPDGVLLALDWDRARWAPGPDLAQRYRRRLARSLAKLQAPAEIQAALSHIFNFDCPDPARLP